MFTTMTPVSWNFLPLCFSPSVTGASSLVSSAALHSSLWILQLNIASKGEVCLARGRLPQYCQNVSWFTLNAYSLSRSFCSFLLYIWKLVSSLTYLFYLSLFVNILFLRLLIFTFFMYLRFFVFWCLYLSDFRLNFHMILDVSLFKVLCCLLWGFLFRFGVVVIYFESSRFPDMQGHVALGHQLFLPLDIFRHRQQALHSALWMSQDPHKLSLNYCSCFIKKYYLGSNLWKERTLLIFFTNI